MFRPCPLFAGFLCTFWEVMKLKPKPCKASRSPDESETRERLMHHKRVSTNWKHADGVKKTLATLRHPMLRYPLFRGRQASFGKVKPNELSRSEKRQDSPFKTICCLSSSTDDLQYFANNIQKYECMPSCGRSMICRLYL